MANTTSTVEPRGERERGCTEERFPLNPGQIRWETINNHPEGVARVSFHHQVSSFVRFQHVYPRVRTIRGISGKRTDRCYVERYRASLTRDFRLLIILLIPRSLDGTRLRMDCHGNVEISGVRESRGNIRLLFGRCTRWETRIEAWERLVIRVKCESCVAWRFLDSLFFFFFLIIFDLSLPIYLIGT